MSRRVDNLLKRYDYSLPKELIAQAPASPRDAARLLVLRKSAGQMFFDQFNNLAKYLPPKSVLVFNDTRVIPARLYARKPTGGKVQVFYLGQEGRYIRALSDGNLTSGMPLLLGRKPSFVVVKKIGKEYLLKPLFPLTHMQKILAKHGTTPIPPYIKHTSLSESQLRARYQTVFARYDGSVAAPTAAMHFTPRLLRTLKRAGHEVCFVTLHVNLGTFAPLTEDNIKQSALQAEQYRVSQATARCLNQARRAGRPIIAVGTTTARTLESAADAFGRLKKLSGKTNLFIREGYRFKVVHGLITNFHLPRSSLLMLVSAFAGRKRIMHCYARARAKKFRFFSFGDAMLIMP